MTHRAAAFLAALCVACASAYAQDGGGPPPGATVGPPSAQITVGPAIAVNAQPYEAGDGARLFPIPLLSYRRGRFAFFGTQATADLTAVGPVQVAALAAWRFQSYDQNDSPVLAGMADRDGTLDLGAQATMAPSDRMDLAVSARGDAFGRHGGYEVEAQIAYELADGRAVSLRPQAGVRYQSASLTDYYFGVEPDEAAVLDGLDGDPAPFLRPAYEAGDAWVPFVGAVGRVPVSRRVSVFGLTSYALLPDAITDSPIVGQSGQVFALLGATYTFGGR